MLTKDLRLERLSPALCAVVRGVQLEGGLDDETVEHISTALEEHLVLFFQGQTLTPRQQCNFASRFGALYAHPFYEGAPEAPEIMILEHDGSRRPHADRWHADVTYLSAPARAAVLYAEIIPPVGGDTLWASMYAAYEALSDPMKRVLEGLRAVHSFAKNYTKERFDELGAADKGARLYADHPPVSHPVVRTNPVNGRRAIFVNQDFTTHVEGLSPRESETLLRFVFEHLAQPQFQIRWRWSSGAVAMWDNRWTQHCALADYYPAHRRVRRATIIGERPE
jgi:taurine dioxygenase